MNRQWGQRIFAAVLFVSFSGFIVGCETNGTSKAVKNASGAEMPAWGQKRNGVTIFKRRKCDPGYRLYSGRQTEEAHLIDVDGREVHRWAYPQQKTWHYAEMQPDGNLIAIIKDVMILELDWQSNLVWKARMRAHHDFARLSNGNTIVVSRRKLNNPWTGSGKIDLDILLELTPENKVVWEWKVEEHAQEIAKLVPLMMPPYPGFHDWPHINTVEVLPDNPTAKRDSRFGAGNLLLCGRHIDTIFILDRKSDKVVWAWGPGRLLGPHMPTMLPNGHILVYDNGQNASVRVRGYTRVLELEPLTGKIVWEYKADPPESFYSPSRGSDERMPNGNTFIAESDSGRLFEVTPRGEMVWEFVNPQTLSNNRPMAIYRAACYPRALVDALVARYNKDKSSKLEKPD